jgi:hypothetical protein
VFATLLFAATSHIFVPFSPLFRLLKNKKGGIFKQTWKILCRPTVKRMLVDRPRDGMNAPRYTNELHVVCAWNASSFSAGLILIWMFGPSPPDPPWREGRISREPAPMRQDLMVIKAYNDLDASAPLGC